MGSYQLNRICSSIIPLSILALATPINVNADLLEEIVVTAKKREENLQDVSLSVTAFSGDTLNDIGLSSSNDLGQYLPGVEVAAVSGNQQAKTFVRGSGAIDFASNTQTTVGVYVDEVYLHNTFMHTLQTFDLARIEVLRGPQGTLYGRNVTGGAINYITAKPTEELSGYAKAGYGNYNAVQLEGAVSGGITDTLKGRVAFIYNDDDGWMEGRGTIPGSVASDDLNATHFYSTRGMLEWTPQDHIRVLWSANASQDKSSSYSYQFAGAVDPATFGFCDATTRRDCTSFGVFNAAGAQIQPSYQDPDGVEERGDPTKGDFNLTDTADVEGVGTTFRVEWDFDTFTVTSISAYNKFLRKYGADDDGSPYTLNHNFYAHDTDGWSQELRFTSTGDGPWEWLIGLYYAEDELKADNTYQFNVFSVFTTFQTFTQDQDSKAVFGNLAYQINDQFKVSAGLRYTEDEISLDHRSDTFDPPFPVGFGGGLNGSFANDPGTSDSVSFDDVDWKLGIDYTPNENWLIYATVGTGYKNGGISVGFGDPAEYTVFDEESMLAVEVGFKSTLWDGKGRLNMSAFYYDYEDLQVFDQAQGAFGVLNVMGNAPQADYYGFEGELLLNPIEGLDLMFTVSNLETEFGTFSRPLTGDDLTGNSNVFAPEWKFTGLVRYEWATPLLLEGRMAMSLDWSWTDEVFHSIENNNALRGKKHWLIGGRMSWTSQNENIEVAVWGKNITETEYRVQSFDYSASGWLTSVPNRPRTFGIEATYRW